MKKNLTEQFQKIVELVSAGERTRNPKLRAKELWLVQLLKGMDQVLRAKPKRILNAE